MKLSENQVKFFKDIHKTEVGNTITAYCEDVINHICDSRNWGPNDTKESVNKAADIIQRFLIDKIRLQNKSKNQIFNELE